MIDPNNIILTYLRLKHLSHLKGRKLHWFPLGDLF